MAEAYIYIYVNDIYKRTTEKWMYIANQTELICVPNKQCSVKAFGSRTLILLSCNFCVVNLWLIDWLIDWSINYRGSSIIWSWSMLSGSVCSWSIRDSFQPPICMHDIYIYIYIYIMHDISVFVSSLLAVQNNLRCD